MRHNVLFIMPALAAGGAEKVMLHVLRKLDRARFQPSLFAIRREGSLWEGIPEDVHVTWALGPGQRLRFHWIRALSRLLKAAHDAEIIVGAQGFGAAYLALLAGRVYRRPSVGILHGHLVSELASEGPAHRLIVRWALPRLTRCVAVSRALAKGALEVVPSLAGKVRVIHDPLPLDEIRRAAGEPPPLSLPRPIVIGAGRLVADKGFDVLIRVHAKVLSQGVSHSLVILGDGEERPELERLARELGVSGSVHLPGFQKNPYAWMAASDLMVHCSRHEGFGMVLVEAMAVGLPVIATDCPNGPAEILQHGECGLLAPVDDTEALSANVARVLCDRRLAEELRVRSARRARDFDERRVLPLYEELFLGLVE